MSTVALPSLAPAGFAHSLEKDLSRRTRGSLQDVFDRGSEARTAERMVFVTRAHWIRLVPQSLLCALLACAGGFIAVLGVLVFPVLSVGAAAYVLGAAVLLFTYHKFFHMALSERLRSILVTNKRVIYLYPQLFFAENEYEIPLRRITDVSVQKVGLMRNLLDFGTLCFEAPGAQGAVRRCIPYVPHPELVAERIAALLPPTVFL